MGIFSASDLGLASYLYTHQKGAFCDVVEVKDQAVFRFSKCPELDGASMDYFKDKDGFLSFRNNLKSLKTIALYLT